MKAWSCCALQMGLEPSFMSNVSLYLVFFVYKISEKTHRQENREFGMVWLHKLCLKTVQSKPVWNLTNFLLYPHILHKQPK